MALRKIVEGARGTLVVYHYTAELDEILKKAAAGFTIYNETRAKGLSDAYADVADVSSLPRPLYLAGFSAGCAGIRTQLLRGIKPDAIIAADGTHCEKDIQPGSGAWKQQIEPWKRAVAEANASRLLMQVSCSSIQAVNSTSTLETMTMFSHDFILESLPGTTAKKGTTQEHIVFAKPPPDPGQYVVRVYPGKDGAAHVMQAKVVLPAMVRDFCNPTLVIPEIDNAGATNPPPVKVKPPSKEPPTPVQKAPPKTGDGTGAAIALSLLAVVGLRLLKR